MNEKNEEFGYDPKQASKILSFEEAKAARALKAQKEGDLVESLNRTVTGQHKPDSRPTEPRGEQNVAPVGDDEGRGVKTQEKDAGAANANASPAVALLTAVDEVCEKTLTTAAEAMEILANLIARGLRCGKDLDQMQCEVIRLNGCGAILQEIVRTCDIVDNKAPHALPTVEFTARYIKDKQAQPTLIDIQKILGDLRQFRSFCPQADLILDTDKQTADTIAADRDKFAAQQPFDYVILAQTITSALLRITQTCNRAIGIGDRMYVSGDRRYNHEASQDLAEILPAALSGWDDLHGAISSLVETLRFDMGNAPSWYDDEQAKRAREITKKVLDRGRAMRKSRPRPPAY